MPTPFTLFAAWNGWPSMLSGAAVRCRLKPSNSITETKMPRSPEATTRSRKRSKKPWSKRSRSNFGLSSVATLGPVRGHGCGVMQQWTPAIGSWPLKLLPAPQPDEVVAVRLEEVEVVAEVEPLWLGGAV